MASFDTVGDAYNSGIKGLLVVIRIRMRGALVALSVVMLAGCAGGRPAAAPTVVTPIDASEMSLGSSATADLQYRIGASDKLNISVFQVPDLTFEEIWVDASGNLQMPMIGTVIAAGLTPEELSNRMENLLQARYLRDPQVSITVVEAANQKITVDGAVTKAGVYQMQGRTTLLQAVAMAEGPTQVANLEKVAVFRTVQGRRMVALFDLSAIRAGRMTDPYMQGDDIIIVDTSRLSVATRDILAALPGLAVFAYFR